MKRESRLFLFIAIVCAAFLISTSCSRSDLLTARNNEVMSLGIFNNTTLTYCFLVDSLYVDSLIPIPGNTSVTLNDIVYRIVPKPSIHVNDELIVFIEAPVSSKDYTVRLKIGNKRFNLSAVSSKPHIVVSPLSTSLGEKPNTIVPKGIVYSSKITVPLIEDGHYMVTCSISTAKDFACSGYGYIDVIAYAPDGQ